MDEGGCRETVTHAHTHMHDAVFENCNVSVQTQAVALASRKAKIAHTNSAAWYFKDPFCTMQCDAIR